MAKYTKEEQKMMKAIRRKNRDKNKNMYRKLIDELQAEGWKLSDIRSRYKVVLSVKDKKDCLAQDIDPFSKEGVIYIGDRDYENRK